MRAYEESPSFGTLYGCHEDCAHAAHYGLLKFFDEHEPELADAIRYGLKTRAWQKDGELGFGRAEAAETQLYVIDKPDSEPT